MGDQVPMEVGSGNAREVEQESRSEPSGIRINTVGIPKRPILIGICTRRKFIRYAGAPQWRLWSEGGTLDNNYSSEWTS
jgi:hypothetical protein